MQRSLEARSLLSLAALSVVVAVLLGGCGYRLYGAGDMPFREVSIGPVSNLTLEPKLQDKLHNALVEECARRGLAVSQKAGQKLSGVIRNFEMRVLAERSDVVIEYRVMILADFTFEDGTGRKREFRHAGPPFIVSFTGSQDMGVLLANKEIAEERALSDMAMQVVSALLYEP